MTMADELAEATSRVISQQQLGMSALTEAPMELESPAGAALEAVMAAREALLVAAREWDRVVGDAHPS